MRTCARGIRCIHPAGPNFHDDEIGNDPLCPCCRRSRQDTRAKLEAVTTREWQEKIDALTTDARTKAAVTKIIWWDWHGHHVSTDDEDVHEEWSDFIQGVYTQFGDDVDRDEIVRCLESLGYWDAENRVTIEEFPKVTDRLTYAKR
jgi:hypothetical protein